MEIFCMFAGILFAYTRHPLLLLALTCVLFIRPAFRYMACFILAFIFAIAHEWWIFPQAFQSENMPHEIMITGHVAGAVSTTSNRTRFQFMVDTLDNKPVKAMILLSWYAKPPKIETGQYWKLVVTLKKPRNFGNPGAYDYERALISKHILHIGIVKSGHSIVSMQKIPWSLKMTMLRESFGTSMVKVAPNETTAGIIQALSLGLTSHISQDDWALFRRTGTTHLMVISGAHIGLVAGLIFGGIHRIWRQSSWCCLRMPSQRIASLFSILSACLYSIAAGFAVPAQRAFLALIFAFFRFYGSRRYTGWQGWRYGLGFVLFLEPHAVLLPGFYLSFIAVVILILISQRWKMKGLSQKLLMQAGCLIGLMPLTLYWFSYGSVTGFIANLFAIPLVGFLIVPVSLFTLILVHTPLLETGMQLSGFLVQILMQGLQWVDRVSMFNPEFTMPNIVFPIAIMAALFILTVFYGRTFMLAGTILLISASFPGFPRVSPKTALIRVIDVGQGLAVLIQTAGHTLLYDAGDQFHGGTDMGRLAILPTMAALGIRSLDSIVISHQDRDHYGGLKTIQDHIKTGNLIVNEPDFYQRGSSCHAYPPWQWDGIDFSFLPIQGFREKNNTSCVLKIQVGSRAMLLTGDIEQAAEHYLIDKYGEKLYADVLLVPHHGSKTSSSVPFLMKISPRFAITSTGFGNRYQFPHKLIVERFKKLGIPLYDTAKNGMISVWLSESQIKLKKNAK